MKSFSSVASAWKPGWLTRALARFERPDARFTDEEILTVIRAGEGLKVADVCAAADIPVETFYTWKARYGGLSLEALRDQRRSERRKARTKTVTLTLLLVGCAVGAAVLVSMLRQPATIDSAAAPQPRANPGAPPPVVVDGAKPASPSNVAIATPGSTTDALATTGDSKQAVSTSALDAKPSGASGVPSTAGSPSGPQGAKPSMPTAGGSKPAPLTPPASMTKPATPVGTPAAAPKPAPPAATRSTPTHSAAPNLVTAAPEGISVQVAALPDLNEARMTVTKLKDAGYHAYMMVTVVNQNELYRVRVGPLKSRELAQIMVQRLERDGYAAPWVTTR